MSEAEKPVRAARQGAPEPVGYGDVLGEVKNEIRAAQVRSHRALARELLALYWRIGRAIVTHQDLEGWGTGVIRRLAEDLRAEFPEVKGFSRTNLEYMRRFAAAYPDLESNSPTAVGELPWGHVTVLLDKLDAADDRAWYAAEAIANGWSRNVLVHQIATRLRQRVGAAPSNFEHQLPAPDSEMVQQMTKDPYVLDFLELRRDARERDIERALIDKIEATLLELGRGFSFVGRQVHFEVGDQDFYSDLVFFHLATLRFVVIELKITEFKPEHVSQLGFYVAVVDDKLRDPEMHNPTVGILLCATKNEAVVRYALATSSAPLAVAGYVTDADEVTQLVDPGELGLPDEAEISAILDSPLPDDPSHTYGDALPDEHEGTES